MRIVPDANERQDPATGYDQAVTMHRHFPNSVLLTRDGKAFMTRRSERC
jgi:hypothetical protein